jgi:hypothetical protein
VGPMPPTTLFLGQLSDARTTFISGRREYCLIIDQLGLKNSSRDFQLNCVISYFFTYIYYFMYESKD